MVTEPAREGGKIVTARNGRLQFTVKVTGLPSHAGSRHMDGRSAIKEMAKQILHMEELTDYRTRSAENINRAIEELETGAVDDPLYQPPSKLKFSTSLSLFNFK